MNNSIKECVFIKSSANQSFIFYINDNKNLIFNKLDINNKFVNSTKIESNILDFSANIDDDNKIHLIFLTNSGDLMYSIYFNEIWNKSLIGKLNIKSNIYRHLNIFLHGECVNIFYVFANLINTNLWTIEQVTKSSDNWKRKTVTNIFSEGDISPFYIDKDSFGNISLVYNAKEYTSNHIYYTFYNIFAQKWLPNPIKISTSATNNTLPYLFVDLQNNIHILWYSLINNEYLLTYKRFSSLGNNKYQWIEIKLPKIIGNGLPAVIFEEDNKIKILYIVNNEIHCIALKDFSENWVHETSFPLNYSSNYLTKYSTNISNNSVANKLNYCYTNISNNNIYFYLNNYNNRESLYDTDKDKTIQELKPETNTSIDSFSLDENSLLLLKQIIDTVNNIEKDLILVKEKVINIEKTQSEKGKFLWFK